MKFEGTYRVALDRSAVWKAVHDPDILAKAIPGAESLEYLGDPEEQRFKAIVSVGIGPIKARFNGDVVLDDTQPEDKFVLRGSGNAGPAGAATGSAEVFLVPIEGGAETELSYIADVAFTGRIAQIGGKMLKGVSERLAATFFENLVAICAPVQPEASIDRSNKERSSSRKVTILTLGVVAVAAIAYLVFR